MHTIVISLTDRQAFMAVMALIALAFLISIIGKKGE